MRNLPEDVDRTPVALADEPVVEVAPEPPPATPSGDVRARRQVAEEPVEVA